MSNPYCTQICTIKDLETAWDKTTCDVCQQIETEDRDKEGFHLNPLMPLWELMNIEDENERWGKIWFSFYCAEMQFRRHKKLSKKGK